MTINPADLSGAKLKDRARVSWVAAQGNWLISYLSPLKRAYNKPL